MLTSLPWVGSLFLIGILISVFRGLLSLQESNIEREAQDISFYTHAWRPSQGYVRVVSFMHPLQLLWCQLSIYDKLTP